MGTTPDLSRTRWAAVAAATVLALVVGAAAAEANPRAGLSSPLRVGSQPGCRWVQTEPRTIRVCDAAKVCRTRTLPAQRIWACGTVRD